MPGPPFARARSAMPSGRALVLVERDEHLADLPVRDAFLLAEVTQPDPAPAERGLSDPGG